MISELFDTHLRFFIDQYGDHTLAQAMRYSLLAPGKRFRPYLLLALLEDYGVKPEQGLDMACALEMIHCYSLIHDDLPAMDDDDLRRGLATNHKVYGEAMAILAGDALLTESFSVAANADLEPQTRINCVAMLATCAGANGMVLGQAMDIAYTGHQEIPMRAIREMAILKTGKLFQAALSIAAIIAHREVDLDLLTQLGRLLGLAFQLQDDYIDLTQTDLQAGKSLSDQEHGKQTIARGKSLDEIRAELHELSMEMDLLLDTLPLVSQKARTMIHQVIKTQ